MEGADMKYLLLILATLSASAKAIICKKIGQDNKNVHGVLFLNANIFAVASVTILICNAGKVKSFFEISPFSLILAVCFAFFLLFTQITQIFAMSRGFASLSSLIYSCGFQIAIFFSALFLDEGISPFQTVGILLLLKEGFRPLVASLQSKKRCFADDLGRSDRWRHERRKPQACGTASARSYSFPSTIFAR